MKPNEQEVDMDPQSPKEVFKQCGSCARTFGHILNGEFGHPDEMMEMALYPFAGGIVNQGHQCGMLWGSALALGAEACRRHEDPEEAIAAAITATQAVVQSFANRTDTLLCREIVGLDLSSVLGLARFMIRTSLQGMDKNPCFQLAEDWAPEAIEASQAALAKAPIHLQHTPRSCASEVVKRMGATEEEQIMVAGFAGGLGLSGEACGALGAALWLKTLRWCRENPDEIPPFFKNPVAKKLLKTFRQLTKGEMKCSEICGRNFETVEDHAVFVQEGGCEEVMEVLVSA